MGRGKSRLVELFVKYSLKNLISVKNNFTLIRIWKNYVLIKMEYIELVKIVFWE